MSDWKFEYLTFRFLLGVGVGAEYPCGSVAASEQSEEKGVAKNAQNRWFALATSASCLSTFVRIIRRVSPHRALVPICKYTGNCGAARMVS